VIYFSQSSSLTTFLLGSYFVVSATSSQTFRGELPCDIFDFPYLDSITFRNTKLTGTLNRCTNICQPGKAPLVYLDLSYNSLDGPIPELFSTACTNMTTFRIGTNAFNGTISTSLATNTKLKELYLDNNLLTGTVPAALFQSPALELLTLDINKLVGTLPTAFNAPKLNWLFADLYCIFCLLTLF